MFGTDGSGLDKVLMIFLPVSKIPGNLLFLGAGGGGTWTKFKCLVAPVQKSQASITSSL